eukprot:8681735-Pyramimonas_sp.AAC.1
MCIRDRKTTRDMFVMTSYWDSEDKPVEDSVTEIHKTAKAVTEKAGALTRQPHLDAATDIANRLGKEIGEHPSTAQWHDAMN